MTTIIVHNNELGDQIKQVYTLSDIDRIENFLRARRVFSFRPLASGLYPAAQVDAGADRGGYHNVWVRDNVFVAFAHYVNGELDAAVGVAQALAAFFIKHAFRFDDIIAGRVDRTAAMNRVHVRFDGDRLAELPEKWSHAQNDALGYFVWLYCTLISGGAFPLTEDGIVLMEKFAAYFNAIRFWEDEDSGHWEETRKVSASSIGVVVGGLEALKGVLEKPAVKTRFGSGRVAPSLDLVAELAGCGRRALAQILPAECVQPDRQKFRRWDAALLFLIYPMNVVSDEMATRIVSDVEAHLRGDYGVRRYIGDSYWCADYRELLAPEQRSADFSENIEQRDRLLKAGEEAQWCVFDPILSVIHSRRGERERNGNDIQKAIEYFNRSLGQITKSMQCPEAYFLERGQYVPNDDTPLLWTQANLWLALKFMKVTAASASFGRTSKSSR